MAFDENLELPRPFGPYTLLRRVAVGGMAEVYVGKTKGIGGFEKLVAIKVIHPRYSEDDHFITMLVEEAKISVLLNHVNIAQTFDLGCIDEIYYIVMEFIEGADAYRVMRKCSDAKKALPIDVAAFIASEMCNGLDYAHRKRDPGTQQPLGIVHRDISPQNILVSFAGEVKIVDFGIAKAASRSDHTEAGVIKGKYYYMSPEQAWGDPMDHRSDVFSTGVVLYELLTGRMLYNDDNIPVLLDKVRKAEIAPPEKRRPSIPKALSEIVMRALAKDPADRYQSAQEMGHALSHFLYTVSPTFSAARLAELMGILFPEENAKSSGAVVVPSSGEIALAAAPVPALAPMKAPEFAPKREQSKLYSLSDLGDEDAEDATRNDVLPYRKVASLARAPAAATADPAPRPTLRPASRDAASASAVAQPAVSPDGSWVSPVGQPDARTTSPLAPPANEPTDQVVKQDDDWEDPTHLRDKREELSAGGGDDFDDSTLVDQKGLYQKVQQALEGKRVVDSSRGRVNAGWARPALGTGAAAAPARVVAAPPAAPAERRAEVAVVPAPSRSPSVPPPPARAAWTSRAPLPAAPLPAASLPAVPPPDPARVVMPRPAVAMPMPQAQAATTPDFPAARAAEPATRALPSAPQFITDDRTAPLAAALIDPFTGRPRPSTPGPAANTSWPPAARSGPWDSPDSSAPPPGVDPFAASTNSGFAPTPADLGKPSAARFVLWAVAAVVLAVLAGVIVALAIPGAEAPRIHIDSTPPGANVSLDGTTRGTTPLTIEDELEVGHSYALEVTLPGYQVWRASIQAQEGLVQQSALLSPLPATLHVDTIPPAAQITVGGAPRGVAPVDVTGFVVGQNVEVRASVPGGGPPTIQVVPLTTTATRVTVQLR